MVHTLSDNGANSIWEHSLLDPSSLKISRRKPQAKDSLQLVIYTMNFIMQKKQNYFHQLDTLMFLKIRLIRFK